LTSRYIENSILTDADTIRYIDIEPIRWHWRCRLSKYH